MSPSASVDKLSSHVVSKISGRWRMLPVVIALLLIWVYFYFANPLFLSPRNLSNLSIQIVVTGVVALGLFFVLVIGEIDLSVAAVGAVSAAIAASLAVNSGVDPWLSFAIGLFTGAALGCCQGILVTIFRAPAFIVTLGVSLILQGVLLDLLPASTTLISLVGSPLGTMASSYLSPTVSFSMLALIVFIVLLIYSQTYAARRAHGLQADLLKEVVMPTGAALALGLGTIMVFNAYRGVPTVVAILLSLLCFCSYVMSRTRFGLYLYAVGANAEAARRAGISVPTIRIVAFTLTGLCAGLGGMFAAGRVLGVSPNSADPTLLLEAIAAVVIGGVSLFGGRGSVWAALTGSLVIGSVSNGLLLTNATTQTRLEVQGAILTAAVIIDALISKRTSRS